MIYLFEKATRLAFYTLKYEYNKGKVTQEEFDLYTKFATMFIRTRKSYDNKEFKKFVESISFPKIERIKKLDLFKNLL